MKYTVEISIPFRDRVPPLDPAPGTRSRQRSDCRATASTDLADPSPRSWLRGRGPSRHQTIEATAHSEDDPATPNPQPSDRTTEPSTKPSRSTVIFEPGVPSVIFHRWVTGTTYESPLIDPGLKPRLSTAPTRQRPRRSSFVLTDYREVECHIPQWVDAPLGFPDRRKDRFTRSYASPPANARWQLRR
jgi:hypothetical protein